MINEPFLKVYQDKSVFVDELQQEEVFLEGSQTEKAQERLKKVKEELNSGYLINLIDECKNPDVSEYFTNIDKDHLNLLDSLVESVTSEVGRAIVALTLLQLCIKSIVPDQSIRLHKANNKKNNSSDSFSWQEGIPMRSLDKTFFTPVLREYGLMQLNADGIMMTRSLAENYPYTKLYKAAIKGAKREWSQVVDLVEKKELNSKDALKYLIVLLINRSENFKKLAKDTIDDVKRLISQDLTLEQIITFFRTYIDKSTYSARLLEVATHSLFQVLDEKGCLEGYLKPLSQMRSANKKHGNVGDVEVLISENSLQILESWDAKYGKPYLREELEELNEKLFSHPETESAGFIVDTEPNLKQEIIDRKNEIEELHSVSISILSFKYWVEQQLVRLEDDNINNAKQWLLVFAECLCQMRREKAPIDEPSDKWVLELKELTIEFLKSFDK